MCHGVSWSNRTHMFCFVSSIQCIVNGLAFVDLKVPLIPANYLCGICTCLLDSLWAPGQSRGWAPDPGTPAHGVPTAPSTRAVAALTDSLLQHPTEDLPSRTSSPQTASGPGFLHRSLFLFHHFWVRPKTQCFKLQERQPQWSTTEEINPLRY